MAASMSIFKGYKYQVFHIMDTDSYEIIYATKAGVMLGRIDGTDRTKTLNKVKERIRTHAAHSKNKKTRTL